MHINLHSVTHSMCIAFYVRNSFKGSDALSKGALTETQLIYQCLLPYEKLLASKDYSVRDGALIGITVNVKQTLCGKV